MFFFICSHISWCNTQPFTEGTITVTYEQVNSVTYIRLRDFSVEHISSALETSSADHLCSDEQLKKI